MTRAPFLVLVTLLIATPALGDSIRLRASVRMPRGADVVRLADVAELEGTHATSLADVVLLDEVDPSGVVRISIDDVRAALDQAGAHWGHVNLSGREVVVRPRTGRSGTARAMSGASVAGVPAARSGRKVPIEIVAAEAVNEPSLRGAIVHDMLRRLGAAPDAVRLSFDADDAALLALSTDGIRFELTPESSAASDRATYSVRLWRNDRVETQEQISMRPLLRCDVVALRRDVDRGATVAAADLEPRVAWLPPTQAGLACAPATAANRLATRRLRAGEHLRERDVHRRRLVERGDRVTVRCLVGGIVLSLQAEARADGAEGERIEFRKLGERSTFLATVTAKSEAVVDLATR